MKTDRALVTGAGGFVGRNLVNALIASGRKVTAMVHFRQAHEFFEGMDVEVFTADIRQPDVYAKYAQAADEVYHLASVVAPSDEAFAEEVNIGGTRLLAETIAKSTSPARLIYISSLSAAGACRDDQPRRETDVADPVSIYGKTKLEAERTLTRLADQLPISVARPPGIFGPWDQNLLALYKSIRWGINTVGVSQKYNYSFVHVTDLVHGLIAISDKGKRLQKEQDPENQGLYFITDPQPQTFAELGNLIAGALGRRNPWHITIPLPICSCIAHASQWYGNTFNKRVYLNVDKIREAKAGSWVCDGTRAATEMDFRPAATLADRLLETKDWYQEQGLI